jgi:ribosomal protein S20
MDLNKEMDQLEKMMEVVRARYLMYFTGRDQIEPLQYRWQLEAMVRRMQKENFTNRMQASRFRTILQKLGNYQSLWNRLRREKIRKQGKAVDKEIEEALKKEFGETGLQGMEEGNVAPEGMPFAAEDRPADEEAATVQVAAPEPAAPVGPAAQPPPPAPDAAHEAVPAAAPLDYRVLFQDFLEARKQTGESIHGFIFEPFKRKIQDQLEALQKKYPGKEFAFRVVIKEGKASLRVDAKS